MKNRYQNLLHALLACVLLLACTPDQYELGSIPDASSVKTLITQNTTVDNIVYLENQTPGILPYWDYGTGFSTKQKDTVTIRFAGKYNILFSAAGAGGSVSVTKEITVTKNDEEYFKDPMWNLLTNGSTGKTWVWNDKVSACFGNGSKGSLTPEWWQVPYTDLVKEGWDGEMTFNLNGAENFSKKAGKGNETGFFSFDVAKKTIRIMNADILRGGNLPSNEFYAVLKLSEEELILAQQGDGWQNIWMFRRK